MPPKKPPSPEEAEKARKAYIAKMEPTFQARNARRTLVPGEVIPRQQDDPFDNDDAIRRNYERSGRVTLPTPRPQ